ncbi:MAG: SpoIIIAC/SpoIIIAD family protein [Lachnospiraceae bacterium]|nr:SpoIIIAC/SpoIIIAD family protein [Lachnospiraceae bacterium]
MEILNVCALGISGIFVGLLLREMKPEYSLYLSLGLGILILGLSFGKLQSLFDSIRRMGTYLTVDSLYMGTLLKIMGITYVGQFSSGICKDAGYSVIANQIEIFAKIAIMVLSMPILLALLETIQEFLP